MAGFLVAAAQAIQGLQCQLLDGNEAFVNSVGRFSGPLRSRALEGINATRRLLGCNPAEDPAPPPPPFEGGQCLCSVYLVRVNISYQSFTNDPVSTFLERRVTGPFLGATVVNDPGSSTSRPLYTFTANNVSEFASTSPTCRPEGTVTNREFRPSQTSPGTNPITVDSIVVTLISGPDDCGSPEPIYGPPAPRPIDIDITFEPDFGPEITVPVTFNFQPVEINFNGTFRIPFNFDFGGFEYSGNVNFNPTANVTINPPSVNPGDGQGTEDQGEDEPGETVPPKPPEQKIIGVVVTATDVDSTRVSQIFNPGMTPTYAPRLGSVKFVYSLGGATFFSSDFDIKDRRTFIECPFSQGADAAIASPQPGIQLTFTEIRGYALATVADVKTSTPAP